MVATHGSRKPASAIVPGLARPIPTITNAQATSHIIYRTIFFPTHPAPSPHPVLLLTPQFVTHFWSPYIPSHPVHHIAAQVRIQTRGSAVGTGWEIVGVWDAECRVQNAEEYKLSSLYYRVLFVYLTKYYLSYYVT